jgi:kynureninase
MRSRGIMVDTRKPNVMRCDNTPLFRYTNDHFAKTGSGQTQGNALQKEVVLCRVAPIPLYNSFEDVRVRCCTATIQY